MTYKALQKGDKGEAVEQLQSLLNKIGAMLVVDGDFGPGTKKAVLYAQDIAGESATGVAEPTLWNWLDNQPVPFEPLESNGVAFIAKEETGGLAYYEMITRWPHFPGHASGITIGVGYDLRFNSETDFIETWVDHLPSGYITELVKDIGRKGSKARAVELRKMAIEVPFKSAWPVLVKKTLPRFYYTTQSIYPSLANLPGLCRSALVSLVFNRGSSLKGSGRKEMREIKKILQAADGVEKEQAKIILEGVEEQLLIMKRIWAPGSGLIKRRQAEANLWRKGLASW